MNAETVADLCMKLPMGVTPSLHGFEFTILEGSSWRKYRLARGGGIAGNVHKWWVTPVDGKDAAIGPYTNRLALAQALREFLTERGYGPRPRALPGYEVYAKFNRNRFGDSWIWVMRRKRAA